MAGTQNPSSVKAWPRNAGYSSSCDHATCLARSSWLTGEQWRQHVLSVCIAPLEPTSACQLQSHMWFCIYVGNLVEAHIGVLESGALGCSSGRVRPCMKCSGRSPCQQKSFRFETALGKAVRLLNCMSRIEHARLQLLKRRAVASEARRRNPSAGSARPYTPAPTLQIAVLLN